MAVGHAGKWLREPRRRISKMIVEETSEAIEGTERECKAIFTYEESTKLSYL